MFTSLSVSKVFKIKSFIYPAGIVIKIPNKKVIIIIFFGSLNLSEKTKNNKINIEGTIVMRSVIIIISIYHFLWVFMLIFINEQVQ